MSLIEQLQTDFQAARKAQDKEKALKLSTLIGECQRVPKQAEEVLSDAQVSKVIQASLKGLEQLLAARPDNTEVQAEITLLKSYLPQVMTEAELRSAIQASGQTSIGAIMKHLKDNFNGKYDGKMASVLAKELTV